MSNNGRKTFELDPNDRTPGLIGLTRVPPGEIQMSYAGIQTFLHLPLCLTPADLRAAKVDVAICGVPWDGTITSRAGAHLGPMVIRMCDHNAIPPYERSHLHVRVDPLEHLQVVDYGDSLVYPGQTEKTFTAITAFVHEVADAGVIPIILGGDHGITWPDVTGLAEVYGYGKIGVVHFDAHADTAPDLMGALAGHGTPMRRLIESGAVKGKNFVQIGLRGFWPGPDVVAWMEEQEMKSHFMAEIQERGFDAVMDTAVDQALDGSPDFLFISLDVDVMDPAHAPGTGSPEPGGLTSREVLRMVRRLAAEVGIVGMDIVEVSPPWDVPNNITSLVAHRAVLEAMTGIAMRRLGITERDYLHPVAAGRMTAAEYAAQQNGQASPTGATQEVTQATP